MKLPTQQGMFMKALEPGYRRQFIVRCAGLVALGLGAGRLLAARWRRRCTDHRAAKDRQGEGCHR